ncbi:MAG: hypothetical protein Sapg2KO_02410 [Saprospiraceae bacterium]
MIWIGMMSAVAAAIAFLLIVQPFKQGPGVDELMALEQTYFNEKNFVEAPIPVAEPAFAQQKIQVAKGGDYALNPNLKLVVPEYAFMDDRGRQIEGEVDLQYREMHNPVDFFLTGIPMYYDSLGERYQLESAGMVEVYGFQDGVPVQLAPGKSLQIELISKVQFTGADLQANFQLYYLDTLARNWVLMSKEMEQQIVFDSEESTVAQNPIYEALSNLDTEELLLLEQLEDRLPAPERPSNSYKQPSNATSFELALEDVTSVDTETQRILKEENATGFWWIAEDQAFDERVLSVGWPSTQLRKRTENLYELTLSAGDSSVQLLVHPVIIGEELQEAEQNYQAALEAYQIELAQWEAQYQTQQKEVKADIAEKRSALMVQLRDQDTDEKRQGFIKSRFVVQKFGVWNSDRVLQPGTMKMIDKLEDQNGNVYGDHTAYLIDRNKNTLFQFYAGERTLIELPEHPDLMLWVVNQKEQMAILKAENGKQKLLEQTIPSLQLNLADLKVESSEEVKAVLQWE